MTNTFSRLIGLKKQAVYVSHFNSLRQSDACMRQKPNPSLVQIMDCREFSAKPISEPMLEYC